MSRNYNNNNRRNNNRRYNNNNQRYNNDGNNYNNYYEEQGSNYYQQRPNQAQRYNNRNNNQQQKPRYNNRNNNQQQKPRYNNRNNNNQQQKPRYNNRNNNKNQKQRKRNLSNQQVLNTKWTIYVHNVMDRDWSMASYKKVYTIETIEDFWIFFANFHDFQKFQFFMMRGDIMPTYEDEANKNGGSYSYMIKGREVNKTFIHVLAKMIGEQLVEAKDFDEIKGISLVPKKGISILKIWLKNKENPLELNTNDIQGLQNGRFQAHKF